MDPVRACDKCTTFWEQNPMFRNTADPRMCYKSQYCASLLRADDAIKVLEDKLKTEAQIKELKTTLQFLRHKFENGPTLGIREGVVEIIVQGDISKPLRAHKFMLAGKSPVFQKMFETEMQEKESGVLLINDTSLPVMRAVIKFCYNAEIEFTDEVTSEAVLEVAHKYEIPLLQKSCEQHLSATTSCGNLLKRLKLARKFELKDLEAVASGIFEKNFTVVISDFLSEFC